MQYLAYVGLEGFYIQTVGAAGVSSPVAILRDGQVLDANAAAERRGVRPGMAVAEAKAILGGEGDWIPWCAEEFESARIRWLDACAEYADRIEPLDFHEAFVDLSDHPQPQGILLRLAEQVRQTAFPDSSGGVKTGLAGCRWLARLVAERGDPEQQALLTPRRFVATLPIDVMPIPGEHRTRLKRLGYRRLEEVSRLDSKVLRGQFGEAAFEIARAAMGGGDARVNAVYPPDSLSERFVYDSPPDTEEAFDNGLRVLSQSVGRAMGDRDLYGERLDVWLEHEADRTTRLKRKFSKPLASPGSVWASLKLLIGRPPAEPVSAVRIRTPELRPARRAQMPLVGPQFEPTSGRAAAIEHVRAAFGEQSIVIASDMSQPRWKHVRRAWRSANGWSWT